MQTLGTKTDVSLPPATSFDLRLLIAVLVRWRWTILWSTLAAGLGVLGVSFLLQNTYKATAIVMPPDHTSSSMAMLGAAASSSGVPSGALAAMSLKSPADLYVALMTSPGVENAVIKRFNLQQIYKVKRASDARKVFESNTQVTADGKSGLITISVIDKDPARAAAIANGVVSAFDGKSSHLAITDAQRRRLFFDQQVVQTKEALIGAEEALRITKNKTGLIEPEGDARSLIGYEAQLRAQIASKTVELQSSKVYLSDENPQVQTATRELEGLNAEANALSARTGVGVGFPSKNAQTDATLDYLRKLREVRYNESLLELLLKNLELARLDEAREGSIVQVVDPASTPDSKDGPHRTLFLLGGFILGLFLSSGFVLARWIMSSSIRNSVSHSLDEALRRDASVSTIV